MFRKGPLVQLRKYFIWMFEAPEVITTVIQQTVSLT